MRFTLLSAVALSAIFAVQAHAARFANQFIEFELPPAWQCNLEGAEWVCQSVEEAKKRDAIIVLAAKLKGEQDSLEQYLAHLTASKSFVSAQGKPIKSDPKYAKRATVNGQEWIDALHLESEIPGFYTRYFATVKQDIGVLLTYSVVKDKFQQYSPAFEGLIASLKVFRKEGAINQGQQADIFKQVVIPPDRVSENVVFPTAVTGGAKTLPSVKENESYVQLGAMALIAVAIFVFLRRRRRG